MPEELTTLWGGADPRGPAAVLNLIQRVDEVEPCQFLAFLPEELYTAEEIRGGERPQASAAGHPAHPGRLLTLPGLACRARRPSSGVNPQSINLAA